MSKGRLFIVSGPSGAGKGTLVKELLRRVPEVWVSVSAATRPPRAGEREGVAYFFKSPEEFDRLIADDGLLEWAQVHGNRYGTPRAAVEEMLIHGRPVVLEIDPQGALKVREAMPDAVLVFIMPPSNDELIRRLRARGSESDEQVAVRMKTAEKEFRLVGKYDHVIINDDIARAADQLADLVSSYAENKET